jgi:hypothetical protein
LPKSPKVPKIAEIEKAKPNTEAGGKNFAADCADERRLAEPQRKKHLPARLSFARATNNNATTTVQ